MAQKKEKSQKLPYATRGPLLTTLEMIFARNEPKPLTIDNLGARGVGSPRHVIITLEKLGFIDKEGALTDGGSKLKKGADDANKVLKSALETLYAELININPNILNSDISEKEIQGIFQNRFVEVQASMLMKLQNCFMALKDLYNSNWDFRSIKKKGNEKIVVKRTTVKKTLKKSTKGKNNVSQELKNKRKFNININIALEVQATSDYQVYDNFFKAMAKHLNSFMGEESE